MIQLKGNKFWVLLIRGQPPRISTAVEPCFERVLELVKAGRLEEDQVVILKIDVSNWRIKPLGGTSVKYGKYTADLHWKAEQVGWDELLMWSIQKKKM